MQYSLSRPVPQRFARIFFFERTIFPAVGVFLRCVPSPTKSMGRNVLSDTLPGTRIIFWNGLTICPAPGLSICEYQGWQSGITGWALGFREVSVAGVQIRTYPKHTPCRAAVQLWGD